MPATLSARPPVRPPAVTSTINPESDDLRPVNEIIKARLGKRVSPPTLWRWIRRGVRGGVRLEALFVGGCWVTTHAAFGEFLRAQTAVTMGEDAPTPTTRTPEKEARLRSAGLLK